uniref:Uncharacterized protein n=1 Tax=Parascaris equorum TaxID=6256 RepID=A0A914S7R5_PAREQ
MASSTFSEESSPQPDSGYATMTSASYDHELASVFEPSAPTPLSDSQHPTTSQANENATIGYAAYTSDDFDYTYGDDRRFVLDDDKENLYRFDGRAHADDGGDIDESFDDEMNARWSERKPRMWTTVFADDEDKSERDYSSHADQVPNEYDEERSGYSSKEQEHQRVTQGECNYGRQLLFSFHCRFDKILNFLVLNFPVI